MQPANLNKWIEINRNNNWIRIWCLQDNLTRSLNLSSPLTILFWLSFLTTKERIHLSREGNSKIQPAILNKWTNHINELGISLADLKCWSTTLDTSHLDWLMVKRQFLPKWESRKSSTRCRWGPFVEWKDSSLFSFFFILKKDSLCFVSVFYVHLFMIAGLIF